jgi:hypothetical protein
MRERIRDSIEGEMDDVSGSFRLARRRTMTDAVTEAIRRIEDRRTINENRQAAKDSRSIEIWHAAA